MTTALHKDTLYFEDNVNGARAYELSQSSDWIIDPDLSAVDGVEKKYWKIVDENVSEMNQSEKDAVDAELLEPMKLNKINQIDRRTNELISQGFVFDSTHFSLSPAAQFNWNSIKVAVDGGILTESDFPYSISTYDDGEYDLAWSDINAFSTQVLGTVAYHLGTGRALKQSVKVATTEAELNAIVDNR